MLFFLPCLIFHARCFSYSFKCFIICKLVATSPSFPFPAAVSASIAVRRDCSLWEAQKSNQLNPGEDHKNLPQMQAALGHRDLPQWYRSGSEPLCLHAPGSRDPPVPGHGSPRGSNRISGFPAASAFRCWCTSCDTSILDSAFYSMTWRSSNYYFCC